MPASNPFTDVAPHVEHSSAHVNPYVDPNLNAAGTSESIAMHVGVIVAFALIGVYVFRASGFKFVVAGSVG